MFYLVGIRIKKWKALFTHSGCHVERAYSQGKEHFREVGGRLFHLDVACTLACKCPPKGKVFLIPRTALLGNGRL